MTKLVYKLDFKCTKTKSCVRNGSNRRYKRQFMNTFIKSVNARN